jgi:Flp pilus assembly pilin Flp
MVLSFFEYLAFKVLETYCNIRRWKPERGQSTAEYVAVTAVAVALAVGVIFLTLGGALNTAIDNIAGWIGESAPVDNPELPPPAGS